MEIALFLIKSLRWFGNFFPKLFRVFAGFFRLIFGGVFFRILVKIYHKIFRLKKNDLGDRTWTEFLRERRLYWLVSGVSALIIFGNLSGLGQTTNLETKISQTVMSHLIVNEFSSSDVEKLIEETASPGAITTIGKESYDHGSCFLEKQSGLALGNNDNNDLPIFSPAGNLIYKPAANNLALEQGAGPIQRTEIIYYAVQNGDTISAIARRFGLTINTILWANNLNANSFIRPGDKLTILPYSGVLYTVKSGDTVSKIASKYGVEASKILSCNDLGAGLKAGQKIIVPGAKKLAETVARPRTSASRSGLSLISNLTQSAPSRNTGSGKMAWPTQGRRITQYFSWRHLGLDIANKIGTPIYAADDGVVIFAGWATGYGNSIVIDHGGGIKTRYGHASKLFVSVGDEVSRGDNIMAMGSTGWSTGSHLHFEVIVSGSKYNPLNYVR